MKWWNTLLLTACLLGCSRNDGPVRHHISGKVTYQGKPVPSGIIVFEPDHDAGNSGPQGSAEIEDGTFNTNSKTGRGIVGGPTIITIIGQKQKPANVEQTTGTALFEDYVIRQTFEPGTNVVNFDVPEQKTGKSK